MVVLEDKFQTNTLCVKANQNCITVARHIASLVRLNCSCGGVPQAYLQYVEQFSNQGNITCVCTPGKVCAASQGRKGEELRRLPTSHTKLECLSALWLAAA